MRPAARDGKIHVIGGGTGTASSCRDEHDVVEEYNPINDSWSVRGTDADCVERSLGPDGRRIYVAGGEVTTKDLVACV